MSEDRLAFYVPRFQFCAGWSATHLLIAAVDLGLSYFRVRTGHEVSLGRSGCSKEMAWQIH